MPKIILTNHAIFRLFERGISVHDAKRIAKYGQIKKTERGGIIIRTGILSDNHLLISVVTKRVGERIIILTVYYGNHLRQNI